jgi:hypothetical protein
VGVPDTSFSGDGVRTIRIDASKYFYDDPVVVIDSAGRTTFAVMEEGRRGPNVRVTRFLADGPRDESFGSQGSLKLNYADWDYVDAIAVDAQDRLLVGTDASLTRQGSSVGFVTRLRVSGRHDTTFSSNGIVRVRLAPKMFTFPTDIDVDTSGDITAALTSGGTAYGAVRMSSSGRLDGDYGESGILGLTCSCVAADGDVIDGRVAITGVRSDGSSLVVRISRDGTSISQDHLDLDPSNDYDTASVVAISGGKTLLGGDDPRVYVARTN